MFQELKKGSVKKSLVVVVILFTLALVVVLFNWDTLHVMNKEVKVFESLTPYEIEQHVPVEVTLKENFGCFMEEYQRYRYSIQTTTTDLYYVIWTGDENAVDFRYMGIKVPVSYQAVMDNMAEKFYYGESTEPIHFTGFIKEMNSQDKKYFNEYFEEVGFTDTDIQEMTLPYYIEVTNLDTDRSFAKGMCILAGVLAGIGVLYFCLMLGGFGLRQLKKDIEESGYPEEMVEEDYKKGELLSEFPNIREGQRFLYFYIGSTPRAILKNSVVWVYDKEIQSGRSKDVVVVICTIDKEQYVLQAGIRRLSQMVIEKLEIKMPWILTGYSSSLEMVYKSDLNTFLNYRYNKVEENV